MEGIAGETAIKLMHKEIGIFISYIKNIYLWTKLDVTYQTIRCGDGIAGGTVTKLTHDEIQGYSEDISPYRPESFDGFVKNKLPGKLVFLGENSKKPLI